VTAKVEVTAIHPSKPFVTFTTKCLNTKGASTLLHFLHSLRVLRVPERLNIVAHGAFPVLGPGGVCIDGEAVVYIPHQHKNKPKKSEDGSKREE
jgi:hypothetical protein